MTPEERRARLKEIDKQINVLISESTKLVMACKHEKYKNDQGSAICIGCGIYAHGGWCEKSPNGIHKWKMDATCEVCGRGEEDYICEHCGVVDNDS